MSSPDRTATDFIPRLLVDETGEAIVVSDAAGPVTVPGPAAEEMSSRCASEALVAWRLVEPCAEGYLRPFAPSSSGAMIDFMIPERLRPRHREALRRVVASGDAVRTTDTGSARVAVDGTGISIEFTVALLQDEAGGLGGIVATTPRRQRQAGQQPTRTRRTAEPEAELANLRR